MSLRARILLLVLFAVGAPAALFGVYQFERRAAAIADARHNLAALAKYAATNLDSKVQGTVQLLHGLSQSRVLDTEDKAACSAHLAGVLKRYPQYTGLLTIKPDGQLHCDSLGTGRVLDLNDRAYFKQAMAGAAPALELVFGRLTGTGVLQIAYPAFGSAGEVKFVLLASLDLRQFTRSLSAPSPTMTTMIWDRQGTVMARQPESGSELQVGKAFPASDVFGFVRSQTHGDSAELTGLDGVLKIWALGMPLQTRDTGLRISLGVPRQELIAQADRDLRQALLRLAAVSLLAFFGAWYIGESGIRRQALRIATAVDRFNTGDLGARVGQPYPSGEVGAVAQAFDRMAEEIQQQHTALARSVRGLEHANRTLRIRSATSQALIRATDEHTLLNDVCRIAVELGGFRLAWVGYAEHDEAKSIRLLARHGVDDGYLESLRPRWSDSAPGPGPAGTAIRTGALCLVRNISTDPAFAPEREAALQRGHASAIGLPLRFNGDTGGALVIYAGEPDAFDEPTLELLADMADDLSFGVQTQRLRARHTQTLEALRLLNENLEQRVAERTVQLEVANKELGAFSQTVAHDLRTPLTTIGGFTGLLQKNFGAQLGSRGQGYLGRVRDAARRMSQLIDDILHLSQITRSKMQREETDLSAIALDIVALLRSSQPDRQVTFTAGPATALCDPRLMRVALENLLGNAWKFTGNREQAKIEWGQTELDGEPVYFVRDNGAGFALAHAHKLFAPFERLHLNSEFSGTGLATVHRIVKRHHGRIWAEAEPNSGSTFYFTLSDRGNASGSGFPQGNPA